MVLDVTNVLNGIMKLRNVKANTISCIQIEGGDTINYACCECRCYLDQWANGEALSQLLLTQFTRETVRQLYEMVKSRVQYVTVLIFLIFNSKSIDFKIFIYSWTI